MDLSRQNPCLQNPGHLGGQRDLGALAGLEHPLHPLVPVDRSDQRHQWHPLVQQPLVALALPVVQQDHVDPETLVGQRHRCVAAPDTNLSASGGLNWTSWLRRLAG